MSTDKLGIKFFCEKGDDIDLLEFIPVFHRWIQARDSALTLIDVADYSHVEAGPGIVLVAHEGIYSVDESHARRGLTYYMRQGEGRTGGAALESVARTVLEACARLQGEPEFAGRLAFSGSEFLVFSNDRLFAPNTDAGYGRLEPLVAALAGKLYPQGRWDTVRESDPKERCTVTITTGVQVAPSDLLTRLAT